MEHPPWQLQLASFSFSLILLNFCACVKGPDPFCNRPAVLNGLAMDEEISKALSLPEMGYSRVWEDHRVLSKALAIQPHDTVLCITR